MKFMQDVNYNVQINANKTLRYEVEDLKMQIQETGKKLASIKSYFTLVNIKL